MRTGKHRCDGFIQKRFPLGFAKKSIKRYIILLNFFEKRQVGRSLFRLSGTGDVLTLPFGVTIVA